MRTFPALFALAVCQAVLAAPVEGKDYFKITPAQPTSDAARIVVTEFFSYGCPHCFAFAQPFASWSRSAPSDVKVERVAVSIGHEAWVPLARTFYALEAMKRNADVDEALFAAIHRQGLRFSGEASLATWIGQQGIDQAEFAQFYRSFSVGVKTNRADELSRAHRLSGVPTLVIDGRYMVTIVDDGAFGDQLKVADELVESIRRERANQKKSGS